MRPLRILALFVLALGFFQFTLSATSAQPAEDMGGWTPVASAVVPNTFHALGQHATLANGQVLFVAFNEAGPVAQRFDPVTGDWLASAPPPHNAYLFTTKLVALTDGRAFLLAGDLFNLPLPTLLYTPTTDSWTRATSPTRAHTGSFGATDVTATLLADGRVLAMGAFVQNTPADVVTPWAEIYDPATDRWTPTTPPTQARSGAAIALLPDGQVLIAGGSPFVPGGSTTELTSVERFDPATERWTSAAPLSTLPSGRVPVHLPSGHLLLFGGAVNERYDPAANQWTRVAATPIPMQLGYYDIGSATPLPNGRVLIVGGQVNRSPTCTVPKCARYDPLAATALYDPATDTWQPGPPMSFARSLASVAPLRDGRVLVVGGDTISAANGQVRQRNSAEIYSQAAPGPICFAETNHCVAGRLRQHWLANGGLAVNGYPLSGEFRQVLEDGKTYTVQYFERVRLELHPENLSPYDVLLGHFGRRILAERTGREIAPPVGPSGEGWWFRETGHNLSGDFLIYWEANGSLAQYGYPLTEVFEERLEDGNVYRVQYFERARFEYHPENPAPYDVLLGQFGRRILAEAEPVP